MLAQKNRFHGHGSLRYVFTHGEAVRSRYFTIKYTGNKRRSTPRVAVVVSKKVMKSAVRRNRIRRRIYNYIHAVLDELEPKSDIVIIVTSGEVLAMSHEDLVRELEHLLTQTTLRDR